MAAATMKPSLVELYTPKFLMVLREGYGLANLKADAVSGLTVAIVALPLSMAIAIASGVTLDRGLYTSVVGGFIVSAFGGSRFQIGGPAGAFIVLVSATVASGTANAIDVALFVLVIGGFIGMVASTGAINAGVSGAMAALRGREKWMIPVLMGLFAFGGATYGMAEETLAFYMLLIPVMIAARYDAVTAVAVILLGAGVGVLGSTVNAFATVIASDAAGIPFTQGIVLRFVILGLSWLACALCRARAA